MIRNLKIVRSLRQSILARLRRFMARHVEWELNLREELSTLRNENVQLRHTLEDLKQSKLYGEEAVALQQRIQKFENLIADHLAFRKALPKDIQVLVSIILPTRNRGALISHAIASVLAQTYTHWELLVIDDGSTDETEKTVAAFNDPRIRYIRQDAKGHAAARNHGLRLSQGEWIAYIDSDNCWYPEFLAAAISILAEHPETRCAYGALMSDCHDGVLFETYDREKLIEDNYIDINTFVHKRSLFTQLGGFDESLTRLVDWDLVLRYTEKHPPLQLPVLAARYYMRDEQRVSSTEPFAYNDFTIRRKWYTPAKPDRPLRVLYALSHYPQLSETYIEVEIQCMKRWGVHIEAWSEFNPPLRCPASATVHQGSLEEAIAKAKPDIIHVHWLNMAHRYMDQLSRAGVPITGRAHGFEVAEGVLERIAELPMQGIFCFPHQIESARIRDRRFHAVNAIFDTTLFKPYRNKNRRSVLRTSAGLMTKDLGLFFEVARQLPDYDFTLAIVTCFQAESSIDKIRDMWKSKGSPGKLLVDVPRDEIIPIVEKAGIYLHTANSIAEGGTPIGMPISIAEAMATGAHILARDFPALESYIGDAGQSYHDAGHAAALIRETDAWSEAEWANAWLRSVNRAFGYFADETELRPMLKIWHRIADEQRRAA